MFDQREELPLLPFGNPIGFVPASRGGVKIESIDIELIYATGTSFGCAGCLTASACGALHLGSETVILRKRVREICSQIVVIRDDDVSSKDNSTAEPIGKVWPIGKLTKRRQSESTVLSPMCIGILDGS